MASSITGANLTTFNALTNLERQIVYLAGTLLTAQNVYNAANPSSVKNVVAISPNYTTNVVTLQLQFTIEGDSVLQPLHENITSAIPAA